MINCPGRQRYAVNSRSARSNCSVVVSPNASPGEAHRRKYSPIKVVDRARPSLRSWLTSGSTWRARLGPACKVFLAPQLRDAFEELATVAIVFFTLHTANGRVGPFALSKTTLQSTPQRTATRRTVCRRRKVSICSEDCFLALQHKQRCMQCKRRTSFPRGCSKSKSPRCSAMRCKSGHPDPPRVVGGPVQKKERCYAMLRR